MRFQEVISTDLRRRVFGGVLTDVADTHPSLARLCVRRTAARPQRNASAPGGSGRVEGSIG